MNKFPVHPSLELNDNQFKNLIDQIHPGFILTRDVMAAAVLNLPRESMDMRINLIHVLSVGDPKQNYDVILRFVEEAALIQQTDDPQRMAQFSEQFRLDNIPRRLDMLVKSQLRPITWVVEGLLPQGLAILAAPPKTGKSWLSLDLCLSVAEGQPFLGKKTNQGKVLYLDLEDSANRLKERTEKVLGGAQCPADFNYMLKSEDLKNGLMPMLEYYVKVTPCLRLVVIDTLQKVRGLRTSQDVYGSDYEDLGILKRFADAHHLCLLVVHHTRKGLDTDDPFNMISGSNGVAGTADTELVMLKENRNADTCRLHITGRDVDSESINLRFQKSCCRWAPCGSDEDLEADRQWEEMKGSKTTKAVLHLLKEKEDLHWKGNGTTLLHELEDVEPDLPWNDARGLNRYLRKTIPVLRDCYGVKLHFIRNGTGGVLLELWGPQGAEKEDWLMLWD